ncbi:MAG: hypothetical protein IJL70_09735 [Treponema sp.]|nr:hypothetical protein [Treponema sp.]
MYYVCMSKLLGIFIIVALFASCSSTKKAEPEKAPVTTEIKTDEADAEFSRSTTNVSITKEEFLNDKNEILEIIAKLSHIMADYDYQRWLKYIDPDSVAYWSDLANLKKASKRLPIKNQKLNSLNDYFRMVFVPSRKERSVEEIRYISRDSVKAVEVREDSDVVYYNFVKINGKWMVKIPPLQG